MILKNGIELVMTPKLGGSKAWGREKVFRVMKHLISEAGRKSCERGGQCSYANDYAGGGGRLSQKCPLYQKTFWHGVRWLDISNGLWLLLSL